MTNENQPPKARILLVDDDKEVRADLTRIFSKRGFVVRCAEGAGDALSRHAVELAASFRPHVAIIDLRLDDDFGQDKRGLRLYNHLKCARCILYSGYVQAEDARSASQLGFHAWVHKRESPRTLVKVVEEAARTRSAGAAGIDIGWPETGDPAGLLAILLGKTDRMSPPLLDDVVWQLHAGASTDRIQVAPMQGHADRLSPASRGNSLVMRVQAAGYAPSILKFTQPEQTDQEAERYRQHIDTKLDGSFHTRLLQTTTFWDVGGTLYSLLGADGAQRSFSDLFWQATAAEALIPPLQHLFGTLWRPYYRRVRRCTERSLLDEYDRSLKLRQKLRDRGRVDRLAACPDARTEPVDYVLNHLSHTLAGDYLEAVTHGDLHGDNLFVDDAHGWLIDFGRTGWGHAVRDFAELEVDIVTRLLDPAVLGDEQFCMLADALTAPFSLTAPCELPAALADHRSVARVVTVVTQLRRWAADTLGEEAVEEYLLGLLFDALFVACLNGVQEDQRQRAYRYAAGLATSHRERRLSPLTTDA